MQLNLFLIYEKIKDVAKTKHSGLGINEQI